ncbi:hypothetical protein [Hymenobacter terrenus]|uniref:hypothetical protein n=1 Tax=Hymenobacter terrenus TaxID=1629124 RepID=UPI0006197799|nr:hypothetical protein [Hymenobacter terrenus]
MSEEEISIRELVKQPSILAKVIRSSSELNGICSSRDLQLELARRLEVLNTDAAKSRAAFIRSQDAGSFSANRKAWGIPEFPEELVTVDDFNDGFLWRFRAHTTSWGHNQQADEWFYTSLEARSVTRYEFWECDEGPEKLGFVFVVDYKSILQQLLADHVYEVLISPAFSKEELTQYIARFSEHEEDYSLEEVIEDYISQNPNYNAE